MQSETIFALKLNILCDVLNISIVKICIHNAASRRWPVDIGISHQDDKNYYRLAINFLKVCSTSYFQTYFNDQYHFYCFLCNTYSFYLQIL